VSGSVLCKPSFGSSDFERPGSLDCRGEPVSPALVDLLGVSAGAPAAALAGGFGLAAAGSGAVGLAALGREGGLSPSTGGAADRTAGDGAGPGAPGVAVAGREAPRPAASLAGVGLATDLAGGDGWAAPS